jgi:hypothetical protein
MTASTRPFDRWLAWALAASLMLHLIVAALFPYVRAPGADSMEILRVNVAPLEILRRLAAPPVPHRAANAPAATRVGIAHVVAPDKAPARQSRPTARVHAGAALVTTAHTTTTTSATAAPQAAAVRAGAQPVSAAAQAHPVGGYMPFGAQEDDPVLDPHVLSALTGLNVAVTLTIVVGDDGRTKSVAFSPAVDPQIENEIRDLLANANWDPAYCGGGIPCEKSATIKL